MKRYDKDYDGLLQFVDFSAMLTPLNLSYAHILKMKSKSPFYGPNYQLNVNVFKEKTKELFEKLLRDVLRAEVKVEEIRQ